MPTIGDSIATRPEVSAAVATVPFSLAGSSLPAAMTRGGGAAWAGEGAEPEPW